MHEPSYPSPDSFLAPLGIFPREDPFDANWLDNHSRLTQALRLAADAESLIPAEVVRLQILLDKARNDTEREAREYQIWYVTQHLTRASRLARERLAHFATIKTQADADAENARCAADKAHWFKYYAWGYDPRARSPLSVVPFELYPRQAELVNWMDNCVFNERSSGIIEKARDEGATEIGVRWGIHNWRYREGFSMLLSSRTEDEVDTKKKQGTLFERSRFQIKLSPQWMWPKGFDVEKDMLADKLIANPENGNALVGQAPVENMGRGDRVTCALFDEFAFWRFAGYPQFRSMSQTTDSILMPSSVAGKLNQFADVAFDGITPKFEMDWRDNPFKDRRWYNALPYGYISPKMSATTIAQEVDRDYEAAQPGKVWKFKEEYLFITQSEFLRPFIEAGLQKHFYRDGKFIIPNDWRVTRTSDYGQSEGHDWSYLLAAQPRESYPLHDTHFVFVGCNLEPTGLTTEQAVRQWMEFERLYGLRGAGRDWIHKPYMSYNSHEQLELRNVLLQEYGETWVPWKTEYFRGIEQIADWFRVIDVDDPNPHRPELKGRCKIAFVAPDGEYQLAYNDRLKQYFVTIAQTEAGFHTLRREIGAYHYPITELGKAVKDMRPVKEFDDITDSLRAYAVMWDIAPESLTPSERYAQELQNIMPEPLRGKTPMEIARMPVVEGHMHPQLTMQINEVLLKQRNKEKGRFVPGEDEDVDPMAGGW
jgi:hypothetical protein